MNNRHFALWITGIIALTYVLQQKVPGFEQGIVLFSHEAWDRPWTLFTSIFAHGNTVHLLFNGYALALFGSVLEEKIGSWRFLGIFLAAGLVSSIADTFFYSATLGASGAIFGVLGTLAVLEPKMTVYVYYIPLPLAVAALIYASMDIFGFFTGIPTSGIGNVANAAHLTGLVVGVTAGFALKGKKPISLRSKDERPILTAEEFDKWEKENMKKDKGKTKVL